MLFMIMFYAIFIINFTLKATFHNIFFIRIPVIYTLANQKFEIAEHISHWDM